MKIANGKPVVTTLARASGEAFKDTQGIGLARELGESMVQIAKATSSLRGA